MAIPERYMADAEAILARRHDQGADYWTTPDRRLAKGGPFSTLESARLLAELGMAPSDPVLAGAADLILGAWRPDGRFRLSPDGAIYPCQTIHAANVLCHLGLADDERLRQTFRHLLEIQHDDGGWRCSKFSYGRGPETEFSNAGPTLSALDAFRCTQYLNREPALDRAAAFLLGHWDVRKPIGPCHYGIGTLFMQVEYPFGNYNLFAYVYILSFYGQARADKRFQDALGILESKLTNGKIVVERVNRQLAGLSFCEKGKPSDLATARYLELKQRLATGI